MVKKVIFCFISFEIFRFQVSGSKFQVSSFRFQVSGLRFEVFARIVRLSEVEALCVVPEFSGRSG
ncbi:hypothetical protein HYN86_19325 [Flavobacterium fluviale]|uniref:Uncharacterized protein n=1 Tax=Flavobacterium fluviale TaxID=2249356 RepID=A0A344LXH8_9FLAO|nr:hypothetical protein HYN86_19325 [Flavobacterium fluviale]